MNLKISGEGNTTGVPQDTLRGLSPRARGESGPFDGIGRSATREQAITSDFAAIRDSEAFQDLSRRVNDSSSTMTAAFLIRNLPYVLLAAYDPPFMARPLFGGINVGLTDADEHLQRTQFMHPR